MGCLVRCNGMGLRENFPLKVTSVHNVSRYRGPESELLRFDMYW